MVIYGKQRSQRGYKRMHLTDEQKRYDIAT